jgi:hypothetical protein
MRLGARQMLDTIEQVGSLSAIDTYDLLGGEDGPTVAQAMVPMLDWPTDLFNTFTAEVDDEIE